MGMKSQHVLALAVPTIVWMVSGWIIGAMQYNRAAQEIERTWHKPANVAIRDLTDVLFGYTALLGLLIGVFLDALLKNRSSVASVTLRSQVHN
jgi:hypothetical protein